MYDINEKIIENLLLTPKESALLLKSSLKAFIKVFHYYIFRKQFIFKPFHDKIIEKLENIVFGKAEKKNLYIGIAPRFGKSQIIQYFICWCYAINRECNFILTSYGDKLVLKFSSQAIGIVLSDLYFQLFGIYPDKNNISKELWKITNGGEFRASPLKGVITGFGAGITQDGFGGACIIDDFLKADNYKSKTEKENCIDVYTNTLKSRLNNPKTPIIIIAQRLAKDDLIGWIEENEPEDWDFFVLPSLDENEKSIWEEKMPTEKLLKMKEVNPFLFYSQYQQTPIILGGGVLKREWWRYYKDTNVQFSRIYITADTAMKTNEWNDYTAIGVWGLTTQNQLYLLDLVHGKFEAPELESAFMGIYNKWQRGVNGRHLSAVYIEDKASGTGLIQGLRRKGGIPIISIQPEKDKLSRVYDCVGYIASGNVYLPESENNPISREVLSETDAFSADGRHLHDDIVDMITYGIKQAYEQKGLF